MQRRAARQHLLGYVLARRELREDLFGGFARNSAALVVEVLAEDLVVGVLRGDGVLTGKIVVFRGVVASQPVHYLGELL